MSDRIAVYPGSFDPVTLGHLNILARARKAVDHLIVAVVANPGKNPMFTIQERVEMLRASIGDEPGITVESFEGLLANYLRTKDAAFIVRGLRAVSDFDYEFQMAVQNRHLVPEVDTLFMMTDEKYFYVSSGMVKEIAMLGGDVSHMVTDRVLDRIREEVLERCD
jgi:pantetheine-phosphate adenylyltransferase